MKVILNISFYGAKWGGSFIPSLKALESELSKRDTSMIFLFPKMGEYLPWAELFPNAIWIDNDFFLKRKLSFAYIKQLSEIIRQYKVTHIVTNFVGYNVNLWFLKKLYKLPFAQVVHNTFHSLSPNKHKRYIKSQLLEQTYDTFIGVSEWVATSMKSNGLNPLKITWVRNAVDFNRLTKWEKLNLKKEDNEIIVFMMGWPYFVKGVDVAIRAIRHLRDSGYNAVLVTPHHNIKNELMNDLGEIPNFVRFVDAREDVATYMNNADVFLSASREEGCPYANVEATFCNCIVMNSDIPASIDLEIPNMLYFESGNDADLFEKLKYCLNNQDLLLSYKSIQREYILQEFDICTWANNMADTIVDH